MLTIIGVVWRLERKLVVARYSGIMRSGELDSVMRDLTLRAPLRTLRYQYVMTQSPDFRGIDVALLYSPLLSHCFKVAVCV